MSIVWEGFEVGAHLNDLVETIELYLNLSPEDAIREFLGKW